MPKSPPKPCAAPGCSKLVHDGSGRCEAHKRTEKRALDTRRGTAHERGYTGAWQKARANYLRVHPLCVTHEARGEVVPATVVDHIVPHRGDKTAFWDSNNWQSLCKRCHDIKTATEDGGLGHWKGGGL